MATLSTIAKAVGTLTLTGQPLNTETVVVGGKTYTFQTSLTDVDGNVKIGATAAASIDNLYAAINLGAGAGTVYAASMTANAEVAGSSETDTTLVVKAKCPGTTGNLIASTETLTNGSWGGATLASGSGNAGTALTQVATYLAGVLTSSQVNADVITDVLSINAEVNGIS